MIEETIDGNSDEDNKEGQQAESGEHRRKQRRRVRKRIRIKKKSGPKRKLKKIGEKLLWIIIIVGFLTSLVVMVRQLNIVDEKEKVRKEKSTPSMNSYTAPQFKYT